MKRIMIIGCPGSGKSTFARALAPKTGLPLHHLDMMYWNPDRTTKPKEEFRAALREIINLPDWIIDGNYGSTLELRMEACDTVIFLCLWRDIYKHLLLFPCTERDLIFNLCSL